MTVIGSMGCVVGVKNEANDKWAFYLHERLWYEIWDVQAQNAPNSGRQYR